MASDIPRDVPITEALRWRSRQNPERKPYRYLHPLGETPITYIELYTAAQVIAQTLSRHASPGDTALLVYPPGLSFLSAFFACLYAQLVAAPVSPLRHNRPSMQLATLRAIVANARPTVVLTTLELASEVSAVLGPENFSSRINVIATDSIDIQSPCGSLVHSIDLSTPAFLQYTSGSTSSPRGTIISHGNLAHNLSGLVERMGGTPDDVVVSWLPHYHDMGLIGGLLSTVVGGHSTIFFSPFDFLKRPSTWLETISKYRGTISPAPNFAYELCVRRVPADQRGSFDLSCWRVAFVAAEPISAITLDRFAAAFISSGFQPGAFCPSYGLAECTLMVTGSERDAGYVEMKVDAATLEAGGIQHGSSASRVQRIVGCGTPIRDLSVFIVDPRTRRRLNALEIGEICVSGPSVASRYYGQDAADALQETELNGHPALCTGDLGFLRDRNLYVVGRIKDLIIIRGRNHHPHDIEHTFESSCAAFRAGCAVAFSIMEDDQECLIILAEVEPAKQDPAAVPEWMDTLRAIGRAAVVGQHEVDARIFLIKPNQLLKTSSGKIRRSACRDAFLNDGLATWEMQCRR